MGSLTFSSQDCLLIRTAGGRLLQKVENGLSEEKMGFNAL